MEANQITEPKPRKFNLKVWIDIRDGLEKLSKEELQKRYWSLYDEMTGTPEHTHSIYWKKELDYMNDLIKCPR